MPPDSMCIYSLCNRRHTYTSLLTDTCIHGCVRQEGHKPPRTHVHAYTICAPKWEYAQTSSHMLILTSSRLHAFIRTTGCCALNLERTLLEKVSA
jgi:hypothetical protein